MARGSYGRYKEWLDAILKPESLDELPGVPHEAKRVAFFSELLKSEELPFDDAVPQRQMSPHTSGLFASEQLTLDDCPDPRGGRTSFIALLFSGESLPVDPVPGSGPDGRGPGS
jgi:hypothetical protein